MLRSLRIPWLADLLFVDRLDSLAELDREDRIDRDLTPTGPLLNRMILRRTARLSHQGAPWPAFLPRDAEGREETVRDLAARLDGIDPDDLAGDPDVEALGSWVAGGAGSPEKAGIRLQRLVGARFVDDYQADGSGWLAACRIRQWTRADPLTALWLSLSGRVRAAERLLVARAGGDLNCVHATAIAVHNIVDAVERLKGFLSDPGVRDRVLEDTAPAQCLRAPETLLRSVTSKVLTTQRREPLRPGTLVVVRLDAATRGSADLEAMFHVGSWAACPAHRYVRVLLRAIRRAAEPHLARPG